MRTVLLPNVTLVCVDCTDKLHLAEKAIERSLEECSFGDVKFLTHDKTRKHAVKIDRITSLEAYSRFMIRELFHYVNTSHALVVQWDGFPISGEAWTDKFLDFDYGGAPFQPTDTVGNGGFGIRSKRFLKTCTDLLTNDNEHPEDQWCSVRHRSELEAKGMKFMPPSLARKLSFEGRSWDSQEWQGVPNKWKDSFGFHSFLSVLPADKKPYAIANHAGDAGDVCYGMAAFRALGGGVLYLSPHNKYPHPLDSRWTRTGGDPEWVNNLKPLLEAQPYVVRVQYTHGTPFSTDFDLNRFRIPWARRTAKDFDSILKLHMDAFGLPLPNEPWLAVSDPITVPGRPIVVARSERYQDVTYPWGKFAYRHGDRMVFVGTEREYNLFKGFAAPKFHIPHYPTKDCLELARVIAGAKVFCGNQSLPLAIAHGLGKPVVVEEWSLNANCHIERPNAVYGMPEELLT